MRFIKLILLCFVCVAKSYGQTAARSYHTVLVEITKEKSPKLIYTKVELTHPALLGIDSTWIQSLQDSLNRLIRIPNKINAGAYFVSVRFLKEKDGSISEMVCLKDPGFGMCEQVKAALWKKFPHKWGPQTDSSDKVR